MKRTVVLLAALLTLPGVLQPPANEEQRLERARKAFLKLLERGEMYGYEIIDALSKKTQGVLEMGQSTLYPLLYNLEAKGLIERALAGELIR